ncbi:MAG TPA: FliM/FliN family flagellar motor switch protein [Terriglobales bacterium]|nr:FliM/FliN family flagellar motor switch protein [Terriglobales bacterium]
MEKVLSQGEIDALFRAARGDSSASGKVAALVEPWDLHQSGLLGKEQLHSISQLHESFARNLTSAVGGYLQDKFEVALVAVEQLAYRDFLARFSDTTYYSTFRLPPNDAAGILHIDLSLAFPMVDLLLGGPGQMPPVTREVTEIEEGVLDSIGGVICHELEVVWQPLGLQVKFERRQTNAQVLRIMPPQEKTLTLTFDVTMNESKGMLNIAFPSVVSNALMRKLRAELVYQRAHGPAVSQQNIGKRLLQSEVELELATPAVPVRLVDLVGLRAGVVLPLHFSIERPTRLRLKGRDCWSARPVSSRNRRAAHLLEHIPHTEEEEQT